MKRLFSRTRVPEVERRFVTAQMSRPPFHRLRLERFPRGVDGIHIDVALDPGLVNASVALIRNILREDVRHYFWQNPVKAPNLDVVETFRRSYIENTRMVLSRARSSARPETAQLFQLATMRLLLVIADQQFGLLRQELDDARAQPARQHSGQSLELHDRVVVLARNEESIRFRTLHDVLRVIMRMEDSSLRKLREAVMGMSWPISRSMLVNPLLQLGGLGSSEDFLQFYPYVLRNDAHAVQLSRSLFEAISEWLPEEMGLSTEGAAGETGVRSGSVYALRGHAEIERRVAQLVDKGELAQVVPSEFDNADGVMALLGGDSVHWPDVGPWESKDFSLVQRAKVQDWVQAADQAGLMGAIRASYRLKSIYPLLGVRGGVEWIYEYLRGNSPARELARRLQTLAGVEDARALVRTLEERLQANEEFAGRHADQRLAVRFIGDLVRYRYDLKLASWMYAGMSSLRLVHDESKLSLSASNGLLQDFRYDSAAVEQTVIGHVVLKADVRGSTEITSQMRARNLNPATHFSRNLYDPITRELKTYGAEKVFVEGDAVILSLMECSGQPSEHLAVAHACGLAQRILQVVEAKNAESHRLGLPKLGLGIGIAYSNEAPTYLFDEGHKIMISPAINRADRLSACHKGMRRMLEEGSAPDRNVVVAMPVLEGGGSGKSDQEGLLRYNVNGIELEAMAFCQLNEELTLTQVRLTPDSNDLYHVGRYLDLRGKSHWLVVRESPVGLWMGGRLVQGDPSGRVYYEVMADPDVIGLATREMQGSSHRKR